MKRPLIIFGIVGAMSALLAVGLWVRFSNRGGGEAVEEDSGEKGARGKTAAKDFQRSKAGLIRTTELAKGSLIDPDAPQTALGEYVALREKTLKKWRETVVDLEFDNKPLLEVLAEFGSTWGLSVQLVGDGAGKVVTYRVERLPGLTALEQIAALAGYVTLVSASGELQFVPKDEITSHAPPIYFDWLDLLKARAAVLVDRNAGITTEPPLARKLHDTVIAGRQLPAGEIRSLLEFLSQVTEVNYVLKPVEKPPALPSVVALEGESVDVFLTRVLEPIGYTYILHPESVEVLSVADKEALDKQRAAQEEQGKGRIDAEREFFKKVVLVGGENLTIPDIANALSSALNVPFVIDPRSSRRQARYSFKAVDKPASEIIEILKRSAPTEVTLRDGKLWFLASEDLHEGEAP